MVSVHTSSAIALTETYYLLDKVSAPYANFISTSLTLPNSISSRLNFNLSMADILNCNKVILFCEFYRISRVSLLVMTLSCKTWLLFVAAPFKILN